MRSRGPNGLIMSGRSLEVDPAREAVVAHLCDVAANVSRVALEIDGQTVLGNLLFPDLDGDTVPFVPRASILPWLERPAPLHRSVPVRVLYGMGHDRFAFTSQVVAAFGPTGARLVVPEEIAHVRPRMTRRTELSCGEEWRFVSHRGETDARVLDASSGGVAIAVDRLADIPRPGQILVGDLVRVADGRRQILRLRVVRPPQTLPGTRFVKVGCRLHKCGYGCVARVTGLISDTDDLVEELYERVPLVRSKSA